MIKENLVGYIKESILKNRDLPALSNYQGQTYTYGEIAEKIARIHIFFQAIEIKQGDKIALVGKNTVSWAVTYLATLTYGAVIVPVLTDFNQEMMVEIINHSDAILLFSEKNILNTATADKLPGILAMIDLEENRVVFDSDHHFGQAWEQAENKLKEKRSGEADPKIADYKEIPNDSLAVISYTSGTTGNSKGVMLSHNSLAANIRYAQNNMPLASGDSIVSFLPLAHAYGCAFEFLFPFTLGCHITFLTRTPSPQIITRAFGEVKPRLILSVPLVIEKIYKKQIIPTLEKPIFKILLKIPGIRTLLLGIIRKKITQVFGGNFHEVVIGGAALNQEAERFFTRIGFPFAIGYGMTECGPLISYAPWNQRKLFSCGRPVDTLSIRIDSDDPESTPGEILVRGENVMEGYYKNEEATHRVIDKAGWLHTGDLGTMDEEQNIFIRGRSKNMILGPSGQNIYPEEIESALNNYKYINEALVIERDEKIVALVFPEYELAEKEGIPAEALQEYLDQMRKEVNRKLPAFMNIHKIELRKKDFERTPKKNIRRFHYS